MPEPIRIAPRLDLGAPIHPNLFGHFLERPSWEGEIGPEAGVDAQGRFLPEVASALARIPQPILRYPAGSDVDFMDWTDLVDPPGGQRPAETRPRGHAPLTTRHGYAEFLNYAESIRADTVLVVNLLDGLCGARPLAEAARHAAELVAWATMPEGRPLPAGMADWRSARGRGPWRVDWVQLGNEAWISGFQRAIDTAKPHTRAERIAWWRDVLIAYMAAIRAVAPHVRFIADGKIKDGIEDEVLSDPAVRGGLGAIARHSYAPTDWSRVFQDGIEVDHGLLTADDWWRLLISGPGRVDAEGNMLALDAEAIAIGQRAGLPLAITEWNWNGYWCTRTRAKPAIDEVPAMLAGTAGYLNGMIRQAEHLVMGCQSMLIGNVWDISGVRADPSGAVPPYLLPQAHATALYARTCRAHRIPLTLTNVPTDISLFNSGEAKMERRRFTLLDAVATGEANRMTLHLVSKYQHQAIDVLLELPDRPITIHRHRLRCLPVAERPRRLDAARLTRDACEPSQQIRITLDPCEVCALEVAWR